MFSPTEGQSPTMLPPNLALISSLLHTLHAAMILWISLWKVRSNCLCRLWRALFFFSAIIPKSACLSSHESLKPIRSAFNSNRMGSILQIFSAILLRSSWLGFFRFSGSSLRKTLASSCSDVGLPNAGLLSFWSSKILTPVNRKRNHEAFSKLLAVALVLRQATGQT